jgi:formylglycine-generating enzyme required for sulfatase activity
MRDALGNGLLGPELVRLRGGRFTMGTDRYGAPAAERPARAVRVGPFAIGRFEVTFAQYDAFARASGRPLPDDEGWGRGDRPVINVSWNDARAYVRWLSRHSGRHYRLPTEAEWEYAYGAGASSLYWWGNGPVKGREVCLNCGTRWDGLRSAPVGSATANPQGLYDMGGNVMEWVQDCMAEKDEPGGGCATRVVRGGAFNKPDDAVHTTARRGLDPVQGYAMVGFRVVRD